MIQRVLNKKLPAWLVAGMMVLTILAGVAFAARYEKLTVRNLLVRSIAPWAQKYGYISATSMQLTNSEVGLATPLNHKEGALVWTSGTGFTVPSGGGSLFTFDVTAVTDSNEANGDIGIAAAGVTIVLPTPTAAMHLEEWTFVKNDSGTTKVVFYAGGLPIDSTSGTTNVNFDPDAAGDVVTLIASYGTGVSWYLKNSRIH